MMDKKNNLFFSLDELIWNNSFRQWVLSPDPAADILWNNWMMRHPEKQALVNEARTIILSLTVQEPMLSDESKNREIQQILHKLKDNPEPSYLKYFNRPGSYKTYPNLILAALFLIIISAGLYYVFRQNSIPASVPNLELAKRTAGNLSEKLNRSGLPQMVLLSDGSRIVLDKNAGISYPPSFNNSTEREVYLTGSAFFDIAKNPSKPFLVYTNGLITKVLGTKFWIHSTDAEKKVSVEVVSGMVSVYSFITNNSHEKANGKKINSLILTPNQRANYSGEDKTLVAALVENPVIVSPRQIDFRYEDTPIDSVFKSIQTGYGIEIIYDEKSLAKRTFTATLGAETLYEKMDIICKALGCRYEIIDGKIVVYSNVQ